VYNSQYKVNFESLIFIRALQFIGKEVVGRTIKDICRKTLKGCLEIMENLEVY
jgi:hypothetical protein